MALIKCEECGKEISNRATICPHCGCPVSGNLTEKKQDTDNVNHKPTSTKKRYLIGGSVLLITVFLFILAKGNLGMEESKSPATEYIEKVKQLDDVSKINGIITVTNDYVGEDNVTGFIILYTAKNGTADCAFFEGDIYKGNGYNGGEAAGTENDIFYNLAASSNMEEALQFIMNEGLTLLDCEETYDNNDNDAGVLYVKLVDFPDWLKHYDAQH